MDLHSDKKTHANHLALERFLFFSDAVFAIAITLLVIEIRVPEVEDDSNHALAGALLSLIPKGVGFIVSFFLIGQAWVEHHRIGRQLNGFNLGLLWKNLFLLFFVAAMPFASALLSEHVMSSLATMVYGLMFAGLGLAKAFLWRHAVKCGLTDTSEPEVRSISRRVWSVPVSATVVTGLAWAGVPFAIAGFMLTPLVALAFDRIRRR